MRRRGLTYVEVLVILVVVVVLGALGLLFLARQRELGLRVHCANNLRRIGEAVNAYLEHSALEPEQRRLPPAYLAPNYGTWAVLIAPHLTAEHPLLKWDAQQSYFDQPEAVRQAVLSVYFCPGRKRPTLLSLAGDTSPATGAHVPGAVGDYAGVGGTSTPPWPGPDANGPLIVADVLEKKDDRLVRWEGRVAAASLERGLAYTLLVGEKHVPPTGYGLAEFGDASLYDGQNPASCARLAGTGHPLAHKPTSPYQVNFGGPHGAICQFIMADGSLRTLAVTVEEEVLAELANRFK